MKSNQSFSALKNKEYKIILSPDLRDINEQPRDRKREGTAKETNPACHVKKLSGHQLKTFFRPSQQIDVTQKVSKVNTLSPATKILLVNYHLPS